MVSRETIVIVQQPLSGNNNNQPQWSRSIAADKVLLSCALLDHELIERATDALAAAVTSGNLAISAADVPGPVVGELTGIAIGQGVRQFTGYVAIVIHSEEANLAAL